MEALHKCLKPMKHVEPYFEQDLVFTYCKDEIDVHGKCSRREITREVLIDYIGIVNSLHKYQICCDMCDIATKRHTDTTNDLFITLDFVFTLLVLSADAQGNLVELHNYPYIYQEWLDLKEAIKDSYDENDTESWNMIHAMDSLMTDSDAVLNYIRSSEMYGLFFNGYWNVNNEQNQLDKIKFSNELEQTVFEENTLTQIQEIGVQQFVEINIEGNAELPELISYTGMCTYIDGALNMCKKKIDLGSMKFNYSVRWVGLKKRFQDLSAK